MTIRPSTIADFGPVADSLRGAIVDFYAERGEGLDSPDKLMTLDTNSTYVERRAAPLVQMLAHIAGVEELAGRTVIDLGCGFGALSVYFAAQGANVTGVDPNGERLEVARRVADRHGLPLRLLAGKMEHLEIPAASFDVAVQNNSFCYVVEPDRRHGALEETLRVLRPGGVLIARNPNRWNPVDQFTGLPLIHLLPPRAAVRAAAALGRRRSLCRLASPPAARRELRRAGFVDVTQAGFGPETHRPNALKAFARYQHFTAQRPDSPRAG